MPGLQNALAQRRPPPRRLKDRSRRLRPTGQRYIDRHPRSPARPCNSRRFRHSASRQFVARRSGLRSAAFRRWRLTRPLTSGAPTKRSQQALAGRDSSRKGALRQLAGRDASPKGSGPVACRSRFVAKGSGRRSVPVSIHGERERSRSLPTAIRSHSERFVGATDGSDENRLVRVVERAHEALTTGRRAFSTRRERPRGRTGRRPRRGRASRARARRLTRREGRRASPPWRRSPGGSR